MENLNNLFTCIYKLQNKRKHYANCKLIATVIAGSVNKIIIKFHETILQLTFSFTIA